ncbi:MAG TPA: hypothetical protein VF612_09795, partial [Jatrophihabitans sp.]
MRSSSRFSTPAWIETSSADTGSSSTSTFGSSARARAIPMRCRCPPENSCGYLTECSGRSPTTRSNSATRSFAFCPVAILWIDSTSRIVSPIVIRGFSDEKGSWKMICTLRRIRRSSAFSILKM